MRFKRQTLFLLGVLATLSVPVSSEAQETAGAPEPTKSGTVEANGIAYYYEIRGAGEPLLLLHGGLGSSGMFGENLGILSAGRELITVDLHGHGRTELGDRPISLPGHRRRPGGRARTSSATASRRARLFVRLRGRRCVSRCSIPDRVRRLVHGYPPPFAQDGFYPEMLPQQAAVGAAMADDA